MPTCAKASKPWMSAPAERGPGSIPPPCRIHTRRYGVLSDGHEITLAHIVNPHGIEIEIINYGGIITSLRTPDTSGRFDNIVLSLPDLEHYELSQHYLGALIGRFANRIAAGRFALGGVCYQLECNDGVNHLHGGHQGFDRKTWSMSPFTGVHSAGVVLALTSPDGDQGYPGELQVQVRYELTDDDRLLIEFRAETSRPTVVGMSQHSYFNLATRGDVLDHRLTLHADRYTPVDQSMIPAGGVREVANSAFDFRCSKPIGKHINVDEPQLLVAAGYDHNFVLKEAADDVLLLAARVDEPTTGRVLELFTTAPGLQFYSGNFLGQGKSPAEKYHAPRSGLCLEPQFFPDSPNQPAFPSPVLQPGEVYTSRVEYRFSCADQGQNEV